MSYPQSALVMGCGVPDNECTIIGTLGCGPNEGFVQVAAARLQTWNRGSLESVDFNGIITIQGSLKLSSQPSRA